MNAWREIQILFSGTAGVHHQAHFICKWLIIATWWYFLLVEPCYIQLNLKLRVLFLLRMVQKRTKSSCSIWRTNAIEEKKIIQASKQRETEKLVASCFAVVFNQQGKEIKCSRNNQTTATKRCKEMLDIHHKILGYGHGSRKRKCNLNFLCCVIFSGC